jgi:hypothetical protein
MVTVPRALVASAPRIGIETPRAFTATCPAQKSAVESAKDGLKAVDRAVSDKIVDGINIGCNVPRLASSKFSPQGGGATVDWHMH